MAADRSNRPSIVFDTLTGFAEGDDDPLMRALDDADRALDARGAAIAELKKRSEPPPPLPPTPAPALAA